jgi:Cys-tRNA(Pro)/Cys-tRNA(Cys) deacylase
VAHRVLVGDDVVVTPAVQRLESLAIAHRLYEYHHDPARGDFGIEAAEVLGIDPDRVFKTLIVIGDGVEACAVVPVSRRLSTKSMATALGVRRVEMCPPDRAQRVTGYVVGGISPIAQKRPLAVVIDETAQLFDEVCVSGGRRGLDVGLAPDDLLSVTGGQYAAIADG